MRVLSRIEDWILRHRLPIVRCSLVATWCILLLVAVALVTRDTSLGSQDAPFTGSSTPASSAADAQLEVLQAQLQEVRRTDERLLQTVYWALGVLAAVAAALIAVSWFTNVRMSERDRAQLRQEITDAVEAEATAAGTRIDEALNTLDRRVTEEVTKQIQTLEETHQRQFQFMKQGLAGTHLQLLHTEARSAAAKGNLLEVLDDAAVMIMVGLDAEVPFGISDGLNLMQTALQQGARPPVDKVAEINELLGRVPERFSTDRDIVKESLRDARSRANMETWEEG